MKFNRYLRGLKEEKGIVQQHFYIEFTQREKIKAETRTKRENGKEVESKKDVFIHEDSVVICFSF